MGRDGAKRTMEDGAGLRGGGAGKGGARVLAEELERRKGRDPGRKDGVGEDAGLFHAWPSSCREQQEDGPLIAGLRTLGGSALE